MQQECFNSHTNMFSLFLIISSFYLDLVTALDSLKSSQIIKDPETLSSNDGAFKLGFFSPKDSSNRYVAIWYLNLSNVVWIANRNQPLRDSTGIFTISKDHNLVVMNGKEHVLWSSNVSYLTRNSTAQLLDTGNLVLKDVNTGEVLWESFQHPCNTFMPKMRLSTNKITWEKVKLTSWKSPSDPSIGDFSLSVERPSTPEMLVWNLTQPYWRSGPWNGSVFLGMEGMVSGYLHGFHLENEKDEIFQLTFTFPNESPLYGLLVLNHDGTFEEMAWKNKMKILTWQNLQSACDIYGFCGAFGSCNSQISPTCSCLKGFEPKNVEEWHREIWKSGCVRRTLLQCERPRNGSEAEKEDGFLKMEMTKVPDFSVQQSITEDQCRSVCLQNCSCTAYAFDAIISCMYWTGNLIDIVKFSKGGVTLYIRVANSELDEERDSRNMTVIITVPVIVGTAIIAASAYILRTRIAKYCGEKQRESQDGTLNGSQKSVKLEDLPLLDFEQVAAATNNFHSANFLGKGGFGPVYKGVLEDGQEVAVKRLSNVSRQGLEEFMNEVMVISKLQHRNLVKLLGCCVKGEEKMLIYEFMPNKSLDKFLFDCQQQKLLDWRKRFNIIEGITRGLIYLHKDSRLKIIHRDLKAGNILLDEEMNPKISDFGMAKIFEGGDDDAKTRRVVGTYGYMAPEYAMKGQFSEKSDVYSFGVLLLEITSGRRNSSFDNNEHYLGVTGFAWKLWNEENLLSLIDPEVSYSVCDHDQILRCIHIGLLCVQELARERPNMTTVLAMLNCEIVNLPPPKEVAFVQRRKPLNSGSSQENQGGSSANNVTLTEIQGR